MKTKFHSQTLLIFLAVSLLASSCNLPVIGFVPTPTLTPLATVNMEPLVPQDTYTPVLPTPEPTRSPTPTVPTPTTRSTNTPLVIATNTRTPIPPTATPLVSNTPEPTLSSFFFEDDFEGIKSWAVVNKDTFDMEYSLGAYHILVKMNTGDTPVFSVRSAIYADIRVEVDVIKDTGPDDDYFGVICRYQDAKNYYRFVVSRNGSYAIGKKLNGEYIELGSGKIDKLFKPGESSNRVRADCKSTTLTLYLNGTKLLEATDPSFDRGGVGLVVGTRSDEGADVYFDNFAISEP